MGCEIRRVPPNWEHPKDGEGQYMPLLDEDFESAMHRWWEQAHAWAASEACMQEAIEWFGNSDTEMAYVRANPLRAYAEWHNEPPRPDYYRAVFGEEPTAYQVYERISEGTPLSPVCLTRNELMTWLTSPQVDLQGDPWDAMSRRDAERFIEQGSGLSHALLTGDVVIMDISVSASETRGDTSHE